MGEVDYFAENGTDPRRRFTVVAQSAVELLLLTKTSLVSLAEESRPEVARLFSGSKERLRSMLGMKARAEAWYSRLLIQAKAFIDPQKTLRIRAS